MLNGLHTRDIDGLAPVLGVEGQLSTAASTNCLRRLAALRCSRGKGIGALPRRRAARLAPLDGAASARRDVVDVDALEGAMPRSRSAKELRVLAALNASKRLAPLVAPSGAEGSAGGAEAHAEAPAAAAPLIDASTMAGPETAPALPLAGVPPRSPARRPMVTLRLPQPFFPAAIAEAGSTEGEEEGDAEVGAPAQTTPVAARRRRRSAGRRRRLSSSSSDSLSVDVRLPSASPTTPLGGDDDACAAAAWDCGFVSQVRSRSVSNPVKPRRGSAPANCLSPNSAAAQRDAVWRRGLGVLERSLSTGVLAAHHNPEAAAAAMHAALWSAASPHSIGTPPSPGLSLDDSGSVASAASAVHCGS